MFKNMNIKKILIKGIICGCFFVFADKVGISNFIARVIICTIILLSVDLITDLLKGRFK